MSDDYRAVCACGWHTHISDEPRDAETSARAALSGHLNHCDRDRIEATVGPIDG